MTYSNEHFTIDVPDEYPVSEPTGSNPVHVVRGPRGRIEIFRRSDFEDRIHGYSSSGLEEFESKLVPKQKKIVGDYELWTFYHAEDEGTKAEILAIADSFGPRQARG